MRFRLLSLLAILALFPTTKELSAYSPNFEFSSGDAFGFIGDEATFDGRYCQYVENYFFTRYPDKRMIFYNAGCKNDSVADVLERLDEDIVARKLDYVLVMLGTNDGEFENFNPELFQNYQANTRLLLDRLKRARTYPILISPPMFDWQTRQRRMADSTYRFRIKPMSEYYNGVMGFYGSWLREEAYSRKMRFVDSWGPLNNITGRERKTNPDFSVIPDAVLPDSGGHAVIAAEIVTSLSPERDQMGQISLKYVGGSSPWSSRTQGGSLSQLGGNNREVSFIWKGRSLPWAMPHEGVLGAQLAGIDERFNRELLYVNGLVTGDYELFIGGKQIGISFSDRELSHGVALHDLPDRPQYLRAQAVAAMNADRYKTVITPLRELWQKVKTTRVNFPGDEGRMDAVLNEVRPKMSRYRLASKELSDKIYESARPLGRHFQVKKILTASERKAYEEAKRKAEAAKKKAEAAAKAKAK